MDDSDARATSRPGSAPGTGRAAGRPPRPRPAVDRARVVRQRRRRAGALVAAALAALVVGLVVGATARSGGRHGANPARGPSTAVRGPSLPQVSLATRESAALERTRLTVPVVRTAGHQHREIALTFDDGPGPYTPAILRILARTHTPATFFEVGEELRWFGAGTAEIVRLGDPIGDHTWSHLDMSRLSLRRQRRQLLREAAAIGNDGAPFPQMYRPPFGRWDGTTLRLLRPSTC